jgi:transposase
MDRVPVFVGIDYHASVIQICVKDEAGRDVGRARVADSIDAIFAFVDRLGEVKRVGIEACCGATDLAEKLTQRFGWSVSLGHPGYVNRMKQTPDKSDLTDAQLLADLTRVGYLPRVWIAPESVRELRLLVRHRQSLAKDRRNVKLRIRAVLREQRIKEPHKAWTIAWFAWLRSTDLISRQGRWVLNDLLDQLDGICRRIKAAEEHLGEVTAEDPVVRRLLEERGVGPVTAWTLRAEIGQFDRFTNGKQLARFCGLTPRNASSGQRQADAGLIKAGNPELRAVLIETAHRLARYVPRWREFGLSLRVRGKSGSETAAAIANRWTRGLFYRMAPAAA